MTIFRLNFLLKVAHILVCQNPSFISTTFFQPNSAQKHDFRCKMISPSFSHKKNLFLWPARFTQKKKKKKKKSGEKFSHMNSSPKMSDSEDEDEIPRYSPQLVRETYTTNTVPKNPRVEYFKEIIRKNQGKNQLPLKDLEFYKSEILSQIPLAQITRKKVRDFCKASRWRVNGNEHTIFNYIIDPVGNDFLPYEDLEDFLIDDFKHFLLAYNELNLPRKRFLNCHHVLFWLLKKNGFHPNEEDFKLLILPQKRAEQEKIIQTIFKKYNWKENGVPK